MQISEPIADYLKRLIAEAARRHASDIHFEPYDGYFRVRYRIDGDLLEVDRPAPSLCERLVSRIKVMSGLDISEKRLPQDGRISLQLATGAGLEMRVSSMPTLFGEKLVLRLMAPLQALPLAQLGLEAGQLRSLQQMMLRPHGLLLVTGPTGSGKSATLYAMLAALNDGHLNLCSVEDPVEIVLAGVNQVAVNDKVGLGFAVTLRALLRQDPDLIMLGEMRDGLTAEIAVRAAQTGHRVWSSLHTHSAQASVARLMNMGLARFNLASALRMVISQRLLRCLCNDCKQSVPLPRQQLQALGWGEALPEGALCFEAGACSACHSSGYRGRIGVFELLPLAESDLICLQSGSTLPQVPLADFPDLRHAGLLKALRGETSLAEVAAVTPA